MRLQGKSRAPVSAGSTLQRVLRELGVDRIMKRHTIWSTWDQVVGDQVAAHTHPEFLSGQCLFVAVDQPTWLHHLSFLKGQILENIHRWLGSDEISEIRFRLGTLPPREEAPRTAAAKPHGAEPSPAVLQEIESCLSSPLPAALETVLRRVLAKDLGRKETDQHR
jgi:predicted nucleic acid-binding Zn ribbon protein